MNLFRYLSLRKFEFLIGLLAFILIFVIVFGSRQLRLGANDSLLLSQETIIQLEESVNVDQLIEVLNAKDVVFDSEEFKWTAKLMGWRVFKPGNYELSGAYSYEVFFSKLALGIQDPVELVILPGITEGRFIQSVSSTLKFDSSAIASVFSDSLFLKEQRITREELLGRMLPETYLVYWTSSPKEVVRRVLREFNDLVVESLSDEAASNNKTINEILTMASIVEWEAKLEEEKATISGLYWNRINRRMRLEADPTVNFALGERRRLLFEDYRYDHPFNTYIARGLPPGPITNPSLSTIIATLRPEQHDFLYMVANPEGGHEFSRTFEEHQVASEKWRRWLREQYRIRRAQERAESD